MNSTKNKYVAGFNEMSLDKLSDFIATKHHAYLKEAISSLGVHLKTVLKLDKDDHPEVQKIAAQMKILIELLEQHLTVEEHILFPYIKGILKGVRVIDKKSEWNSAAIVSRIKEEHKKVEASLDKIRKFSKNYTPDVDSSPALKLCYAQLFDMEQDMHKHVFVEENVLFPKLLEFEKRMINSLTT